MRGRGGLQVSTDPSSQGLGVRLGRSGLGLGCAIINMTPQQLKNLQKLSDVGHLLYFHVTILTKVFSTCMSIKCSCLLCIILCIFRSSICVNYSPHVCYSLLHDCLSGVRAQSRVFPPYIF